MAGHRAVRRLVLELPVRAHQHRGHHAQRSETGRHHVALHVSIIVHQRPEDAPLVLDDLRDRIVDQQVAVRDAGGRKIRGARGGLLGENRLEEGVVGLADRVLRREPEVDLFGEGIAEAGPGE